MLCRSRDRPGGGALPAVRDCLGEGSQRICFSSAILPPYARRSKSLEVLLPILYLKGISTGQFEEALALLGKDADGLSASTICRLKDAWSEEHMRWSKRELSAKGCVYYWADGIHVQGRLEDDAQCLLVIVGATPEGKKTSRPDRWRAPKCALPEGTLARSEAAWSRYSARAGGGRRRA